MNDFPITQNPVVVSDSVLVAFLFGALTGAGIALLLAPRPGRETREALGEKLKDTAERGRGLLGRG